MFHRPWWQWLSRYRHTRGFGVHSPLAYRIITEVIPHDKSRYYPVRSLGTMTEGDYLLTVAVMSFLRPQSVWVEGDPALARRLHERVDSAVELTRVRPEMVIVAPGAVVDVAFLVDCLTAGGSMVIVDCRSGMRSVALDSTAAMMSGMTFSNGRTLIAVARPDLPRQHFELNFS